ncbi:MAG TPA: ABC transporter permease [Bryobacteraceae bacterium]|nr:ABC transporter permease [Bryobacteraceae bacterium]
MRTFLQDLLYSFRQLRHNPAFALTAVVSIALGIGATTAVFSVVYAVVMNPYPYRDAGQLVYLNVRDKAGIDRGAGLNVFQIRQVRRLSSIESVVAMNEWNLTTTDSDLPEDVIAWYLTPNGMTHLGVPPLLGRGLIASDAPEGQDPQPVVVLGYKFWQKRYAGRPDIIGQTLQLVHKRYAIVGVMPARFTWQGADLYLPLKLGDVRDQYYFCSLRLKPGLTRERANAELQPLIEQFARETPNRFPSSFRVQIQGLNDWVRRNLGGTLALLFAAVALMLLIGCGNVSILLLARGAARQAELAVRTAIGAGRVRIVRQLLTEALSLSLCGALIGVLLASQLIRAIVKWMPENLFPSEAAIHINLPVLLFSVILALATGVLFGLWPAFHLSRPDLAQVMQSGSRRTTGGPRGKRTHSILVAAQVALTLLLLTGAGEAIAAFRHLMRTDLGYDPTHTMSIGIPVHDNTHMKWEDRAQYFEQIRARAAQLPGVVGAAISTNATPPSNGWDIAFEIFGRNAAPEQTARANFVSPEYFAVLRIPLAAGRMWTAAETLRGARLALINQTMARQYWPNVDPVGRQIRLPLLKAMPPYSPAAPGSDDWLQIIGVVADVRDDGLRKPVKPGIYVPYAISMRMFTQILIRARGEPLALLRQVRREVNAVDSDQQVMGNPQDLEQWITNRPEWAGERLATILLSGFSILALALAVAGLYSVVSHAVVRRTNEFGIRIALGACSADVLRLVFRSTVASVGGGLAAGVLASFALARVFAAWTQEASRDPLILIGVMLLLAAAAAAACLIPARRASSIDPMAALRYE